MDLRQMHVPDDYFGNAQCIQAVSGQHPTCCVDERYTAADLYRFRGICLCIRVSSWGWLLLS